MKVLHIVPALFGTNGGIFGGAERYAFELARYMARVVDTTLLSFGPDEQPNESKGDLRVRILPRSYYVRAQRTNPIHPGLFGEILKADIVHCHQSHVLASSIAAISCRLLGKPVYATDLGGGGWDISGYLSTDSWFNGHLHISEYSRRIANHASRPNARVILGGVDSEKFSPVDAASRNKVLFVGRLLPHKGVDDLIRALPNDMEAVVIGQPQDHRYLTELENLARGKMVQFRCDCDDAELIQAYRSALGVVLPSVYRDMYGNETKVPELLGQTLLEGMACEAATVTTNVASLPEIVQDGVTGFVVPPNNPEAMREKLCWLHSHPNEARKMGARGRQRVLDCFRWEMVVERCLEAYESRGA